MARHRIQHTAYEEDCFAEYLVHTPDLVVATVEDPLYNARFEVKWNRVDNDSSWQLEITTRALNTDREARVTPFVYLHQTNAVYSLQRQGEDLLVRQ